MRRLINLTFFKWLLPGNLKARIYRQPIQWYLKSKSPEALSTVLPQRPRPAVGLS